MDRNVELYKKDKELNKEANNIYSNIINICLFIVIIFEYFKTNTIQYNLFLIFFIGQLTKSIYKYTKDKNNFNLACSIGCVISIVALIVLIII